MGFSFSGAAPNQGLIFAQPEAVRRARGRRALRSRRCSDGCAARCSASSGAMVIPFAPPPIPGLGAFGGFEFQVLDQAGGRHRRAGARDVRRWSAPATSRRGCAGCSARSPPTIRSSSVDIDRERALALGLPLSEVTSALQIYLGSQYVNDFDFNNRAYRVYVQADKAVPVGSAER